MRRLGGWLVAAALAVGALTGCGRAEPNKNKDYDRPKASPPSQR